MLKLIKSDLREIEHDMDPAHLVGYAVHDLCSQVKYVCDLAEKYPEHMLGEHGNLSEHFWKFVGLYTSLIGKSYR